VGDRERNAESVQPLAEADAGGLLQVPRPHGPERVSGSIEAPGALELDKHRAAAREHELRAELAELLGKDALRSDGGRAVEFACLLDAHALALGHEDSHILPARLRNRLPASRGSDSSRVEVEHEKPPGPLRRPEEADEPVEVLWRVEDEHRPLCLSADRERLLLDLALA
jgi:hypothetical protein